MVTSDRLRSQGKKDTHDMGINLILMKVLFSILISFLVAKQVTGDNCSNHYHSYVRSKSRKIHPALATHNHEQMRSSATSVTSSSKELVLGIRAGADNPYVDICSTCSRESVFIGSILPTIKKVFRGGGDHYSAGFEELKKDFNLEDALIIAFVSFLFEPCLCIFHDLVTNRMLKLDKKYDISLAKKVGEAVKEIGEIGIIVYCVELFTAFVEGNLNLFPIILLFLPYVNVVICSRVESSESSYYGRSRAGRKFLCNLSTKRRLHCIWYVTYMRFIVICMDSYYEFLTIVTNLV